jgi:hypothetical protein
MIATGWSSSVVAPTSFPGLRSETWGTRRGDGKSFTGIRRSVCDAGDNSPAQAKLGRGTQLDRVGAATHPWPALGSSELTQYGGVVEIDALANQGVVFKEEEESGCDFHGAAGGGDAHKR